MRPKRSHSYRKVRRKLYSGQSCNSRKRRRTRNDQIAEPELKGFFTQDRIDKIKRELRGNDGRVLERKQRSNDAASFQIDYLEADDVTRLNRFLLDKTKTVLPEESHVLNRSALINAVDAPKRKLFGEEIFSSVFEKAAVLPCGYPLL